MSSTITPRSRSTSPRRPSDSSRTWATLCAETLAGIADPLFPALTLAATAAPREAARAVLRGLLDPLDAPQPARSLPDWLLPHQADAVARAASILDRFGGVLVADGVGLGKTFIALALAALEREGGGETAAVVPAALRHEWVQSCRQTGVPVQIHTHTQLARSVPRLSDRVRLVIVDEAHGFRNPATRRYAGLADLVAGRRVALLTATPLNNTPADIASLVRLFAGRDRFREFGVPDLSAALRAADPGSAMLALAAIAVCRSRRLVQARFPALVSAFPARRLAPPVEYDLEATYARALGPLLESLAGFAAAGPAVERGAALLHLALLRRLESSRAALRRTLRRHRVFLTQLIEAASCGRSLSRRDFQALFPRSDADEEQLVLLPVLLGSAGGPAADDVAERLSQLDAAAAIVAAAEHGGDAKLDALVALLDGALRDRKTLVFTEYRDTALYLARALRHRFRLLAVTGRAAWAGPAQVPRRVALDAFAPVSRRAAADPLLDARLLIATDVASEGMNLQDATAVVNYDLPWNPVRVMQRVGRVDRLGALGRDVAVAHLLPCGGMRALTGVLRTLRAKLDAAPRTLGVEPDPLASLWWLDRGRLLPETLEAESWRRVEPFEAAERWRMIAGPPEGRDRTRPLIAAGIAPDDAPPALGVLLALEWPGGSRVPLPFVTDASGGVRQDGFTLGQLAMRALAATPLPTAPTDFTCALATVLPHARARLLSLSACRHGTDSTGPGRRRAVETLLHAAHRAEAARDAVASDTVAQALAALKHELPEGLDRAVGRLLDGGLRDVTLARHIRGRVAPALPPSGPALTGTPRLVLVAAIALVARCPSDP